MQTNRREQEEKQPPTIAEKHTVEKTGQATSINPATPFVRVYSQHAQGHQWLERHRGRSPLFVCVLGFTETGLISGISAAGATPRDRQYTAIADAEFLSRGVQPTPTFPLPPLHVGASPALISRAVIEAQTIPLHLFNAGLPHAPAVPAIDLSGTPARCLSQGHALSLATVKHLFDRGLTWGEQLATQVAPGYLVIGECVVGGTTTALAVLTGLGIAAHGKINSSHPTCNHDQKWGLVQTGLQRAGIWRVGEQGSRGAGEQASHLDSRALPDPLAVVAAVGDPMQVVVAGMAIAASRHAGVLLAGGTQMLAVYALAQAITTTQGLCWQPEQIVVGTTRWVADDATGDTVGLAQTIGQVPLLATQLNFANSRHPQLRAYEQGYVKEGVGAGGCAIAAHLYQHWGQDRLFETIELLADRYLQRVAS